MEETVKLNVHVAKNIIIDLKKEIRHQQLINKKQNKMRKEMIRLQVKLEKLQKAAPYRDEGWT